MYNPKFYSFLGLCQRAGQLTSGEVGVSKDIKKGNIKLLIIAQDTSDNTKDTFVYQAQRNKVPILNYGDKETLGASIGKNQRALVGIKDKNMAINLIKIYENK